MAMGPFRMSDLAGLDIGWAARKRRAAEFPDRDLLECRGRVVRGRPIRAENRRRVVPLRSRFAQRHPGSHRHRHHREVPPAKGHHAAQGDRTQEIVERCIYALINEGARIVEDGIAQRSSDIDIVYLNGYGFPAWRGGPMFYADQVGLSEVARALEAHRRAARRRQGVLDAGAAARAPRPGR